VSVVEIVVRIGRGSCGKSHMPPDYGVNVEELQNRMRQRGDVRRNLVHGASQNQPPESCNAAEVRRKLEKIAED